MKICYVITKGDEIGGAQVHVRDLCNHAKENCHEVFVIVGENGLFVDQLRQSEISVFVVPTLVREISPIKDLKAVIQILSIVKCCKADIIALHSSKAGIIGRVVSNLLRIPVVFTAHGWAFADGVSERKRKLYIAIEKLFAFKTDRIITVSEQDRNLALKYNVAKPESMVTIHNGVCDIGLPEQKSEKDIVNLIMVARFSDQKDHKTLFSALPILESKNWTLTLVGKGINIEKYQNAIKGTKFENKVHFLGERNDVPELLKQSDVFLLISNWEGYPMSTLEAMSAGLPVVVSDVGGSSEAVQHGYNGFLVPRKGAQQLAEHLDALIMDENLRETFSRNNRIDFENKHTVEQMCVSTFNLYHSFINKEAEPTIGLDIDNTSVSA